MLIFHSYVKLPEGKLYTDIPIWLLYLFHFLQEAYIYALTIRISPKPSVTITWMITRIESHLAIATHKSVHAVLPTLLVKLINCYVGSWKVDINPLKSLKSLQYVSGLFMVTWLRVKTFKTLVSPSFFSTTCCCLWMLCRKS